MVNFLSDLLYGLSNEDQTAMKTFGRLIRNFAFMLGLILTLVLIISALAAPLLAPHDPFHQDTARRLEAPSDDHPLGRDDLGATSSPASSTARACFAARRLQRRLSRFADRHHPRRMAGYFGGLIDML